MNLKSPIYHSKCCTIIQTIREKKWGMSPSWPIALNKASFMYSSNENIKKLISEAFDTQKIEGYEAAREQLTYRNAEKKWMKALSKMIEEERLGYYQYNASYKKNQQLDEYYAFLCSMGYEMSDIEKELMNGTSELFKEN